ncbi:AMP-binding protein [Mycobacterium camsae]|uniref:AMP-binding protein n=1 Tax=Mycobacterium gordonae TaxID=1778 RepID=UPI001981677D|nr:AMP-binding protein [Mycobacterium gordonae]
MRSDQCLREELAGVLRDAGLDPIDDPDILDFDFTERLGLGSIELADLLLRVSRAYAVELPSDAIGRCRRPRDLLEAIEYAPGAFIDRVPITQAPGPANPAPAITSLAELRPAPSTLLDLLRVRAERDGSHPHLRFLRPDGQVQTLTYAELWDRAGIAAAGLAELGLVHGERVAILALTGPDFFVAFVATLCAGGIPVPIYPPVRLDDLDGYVNRQSRILHSAGTALIISDPLFTAAANLLCAATPSIRRCTAVSALSRGREPFCVDSLAELALIQYTSGSTGDPKGVALTHANLIANTEAIGDAVVRAGLRPSDAVVSWMPLYHDFGLIGTWMGLGLFTGVSVVLISPVDFLTKPALWLWAIDRFRAAAVATTPFALNHVTRRVPDDHVAGLDLSSLKLAFLGAEPIRANSVDEFCRRFEPYGFRRSAIAPAYGLAESCVGVALSHGGRHGPRVDHVDAARLAAEGCALPAERGRPARSIVSVGVPIRGQQIRVVDAAHRRPLPERWEGRILVRGRSVMSGYFGRPEATAAVLIDGWLDTGDLGYFADGELFITGRVKDLIIKAGRNFHPQDIEHAVGRLTGVRKGCVIAFGVPSRDAGEGIVVVLETTETTTDFTWCHGLKASVRAAVVETTGTSLDDVVLIRRGSMLKTSSGKLRRQETRQAYLDGSLTALTTTPARAVARGWRRAGRCREVLVGAYITVMTMLVVLITTVVTAPLRGQATAWRITRRMLALLFAATGISFRRKGVRLPDGQALYVSNHPTELDPLLLIMALDRPVTMTAKARLLGGPLGVLARRLGVIAVEPGSAESSLTSYDRMAELLAEGASIHLFPEGERRDTPGIYPFRLGAFKLAATTGVPIIPLALRGPRKVMGGRPYRPAALEVEVLPAVRLDCDPTDLAALAAARTTVRHVIAAAAGEPLVDTRGLKRPVVKDSPATRLMSWGRRLRA